MKKFWIGLEMAEMTWDAEITLEGMQSATWHFGISILCKRYFIALNFCCINVCHTWRYIWWGWRWEGWGGGGRFKTNFNLTLVVATWIWNSSLSNNQRLNPICVIFFFQVYCKINKNQSEKVVEAANCLHPN